jgi:uncharacterized protein (DUF1501 family)
MATPRPGPYGLCLTRRAWLQCSLGAGLSLSGWLPRLAAQAANNPQQRRSCIVLWMSGGPAQTDTFDPKPGHVNGGPFAAIPTSVPGVRIAEHLPQVAQHMQNLALIRSMRTREGDHGRATYHLRTGYLPMPPIEFPTLGSLVAREREQIGADLPSYVSIAAALSNPSALSPGFLGPRYAPLIVGQPTGDGFAGTDGGLRVQNLARPNSVSEARLEERLALLQEMQAEFVQSRSGAGTASYQTAYARAQRLMSPTAAQAFDLNQETAQLRDAYGRSRFGQGCLLARRLVERGVPFVEVMLGGWDTHDDNFNGQRRQCSVLDPAWATLMTDLAQRGLLDSTLIVWMGEFGRTPTINPRQGRDHYPAAWSVVLGGGGIRGGHIVGRTSADGSAVEERPVSVPDLVATICLALGLDPARQNMSSVGRPIRVVEPGFQPIQEILA